MDDQTFFSKVTDWVTSSGLNIVIILGAMWLFRRFGKLIIQRAIRNAIKGDSFASARSEEQREDTLISIVDTAAGVVVWLIAGMLIVQEIGMDIGPLLAGASVLGFAIGFGAQSLVKDFVAGLFIIMENQYRIGDVVSIAGVSGTVESITMRETVIRNVDGHVHHVPNGIIDVSTNKTMDFSKINLTLSVAYDTNMEKVEKIIDEVGVELMNDKEWTDKIVEAPRFVWIKNFGPSEIDVKVSGKVEPGSQWSVAGEFRARIKKAFDKNKIEIPFPQRVIHQAKK